MDSHLLFIITWLLLKDQKLRKNLGNSTNLDYSRVEVAADAEKQKIVNGKW